MRAVRTVVVVALAASLAASAEERSPDVAAARSRQIAAILGLEPVIERIASAPSGGGLEATLERLQLRDDILAELQRISLLINATVAQLEEEHAAATTAQSYVENGYTRAVASWNIAALIVGSGLSIVGSSMQFDGNGQAFAGDGIIIAGAAIATAFSIVALTRKNQGRTPHAITTNFLAPLLGRTPSADSMLPEPVWRYLDTPLAGEPGSLRSQLIELWGRRGTIARTDSPSMRRKIDLLTRPVSRREVVPADVLDDRAEMLADLRSRVASMHVELQALVREVRAHQTTR
jgi:hypothetical protein